MQNADSITGVVNKFDSQGHLKELSGYMVESDFAEMFSAALASDGTVQKKSEMGTYVQKDIYGYISGAYINADRIDFKTNGLTVRNDSGQTTLQLDTNGNLTVRGTINGGSTIGGFSVNSNSLYMSEDSDGRYTDLEHGSLSIRTARSGTEYGLSVTGRIKVYAYDANQTMRECLDFQGIDSGLNAIWQFSLLPTSKPSNTGYLWNDNGTLKIS